MFKLRVSNKNSHKFATRKKMAGSGARYKIEFDIDELMGTSKLGIEEIITKPADEEGIPFEIKGFIPVRITIKEASSDEYELDWPIKNVRAVITRLEGYAPAEEESWRSYWDIDDPIQVDDFIEGLFNDSKYMDIEAFYDENQNYNGFDGVLNNIEFYNGAHEEGITGMDLRIPGIALNPSATKNGCDKKFLILLARLTIVLSSSESSSIPKIAMMS